MFCAFIFAVLLLKYWFPTSDQLERYCTSDISYSSPSQVARRHILHKQVIAHFVPNFVPIATRVSQRKIRLPAFNGHPRKSPYRHKNLTDIFYRDRVIANFVPNFVAMATGVGQGKMLWAAFNGPSPKTSL